MRILHVVPSYYPAVRYGGPIVSVHGLCKALVQRGHDVHVFTTNVDGNGESKVPVGLPVELDGVKVWYFPVLAVKDVPAVAALARRLYWSPRMGCSLRQQISSFDVVHTHSVFLWPTWAAARVASQHMIPYVLAPRGMLVADLIRRKSRLVKTAWLRLIERSNVENAAAIHVTSRIEGDDLAQFGMRLPPLRIVPNGVDAVPADRGDGGAAPDIAALATRQRYLLFIGRINWKKGLDRLIPAMALLTTQLAAQETDLQLLIAGNDEEAYQPVLEALAQQHGVSEKIRFIGPAYGSDKQALLRGATALVVPSYSENFGNVVLEAMATGCPVVVTPEMGVADLVRESGAGIVVNGDPASLAAGIARLLSEPESLRNMAERGKAMVAQRYGWDTVAQQMEDVYRECVIDRHQKA